MKTNTNHIFFILTCLLFFFTSCSTTNRTAFKIRKNDPAHVRYPSPKKTTTKTTRKSTVQQSTDTGISVTSSSSEANNISDAVVNYAKNYIGVPYVYGGKSPNGFDCSGYTSYVYNKAGINISPASSLQKNVGKRVKIKNAQKGDLAFFGKNNKVSHVALVVSSEAGKLEVIHATSSRGVMQQDVMRSNYWKPKLLFVRRVIGTM